MKKYITAINKELLFPVGVIIRDIPWTHPRQAITQVVGHFAKDSLYRNSIYLMLGTLIMAVFGFLFWFIIARLYSPEEVGLTTTLISVVSLISSFSLLGLNAGLIRYLPGSEQKNEKINTSFTLVTLAAIVLSIIYLLSIDRFTPKLLFVRENMFYSFLFILFTVFLSLNTVIESIFIAFRSARHALFKNTILSITKLIFPLLLLSIGAYGVFISFGASLVIACLFSIFLLVRKFKYAFNPVINFDVLRKMTKFSFGNYLSGFIGLLPMNLLPILITNKIGPGTSAYFYIGMMIINVLYIIPFAASQSLFAEGSHSEEELLASFKKALSIIFYIMLPAILITILFGNYALLVFGKKYSIEGFTFLRILAFAGLFASINQIGSALLNIRHKISYNIFLNIISVLIILSLSYLLISEKLVGVGIAWLIGNGVIALIYLFLIKKYL